jgi:hypothetical protein
MDEETIPQGPPLTLGLILGGARASRLWEDAVKKLMIRVKSDRPACSSSCRVQVVFDVPGEVTSPESTGIIFPRQAYKPAERRIYVGIGLPLEPSSDAYEEAVQFLRQALEEAESYLTRKRIPGDLDAAMEVVRDLASR